MKTKSYLMAAFAALTLFSCSNDLDENQGYSGDAYMNFSLNFDTPKLRSVDDDHNSGTPVPGLTQVTVKFKKDGVQVGDSKVYITTDEKWADLIGGRAVMMQIPASAETIEVIGNSEIADDTKITDLQGYSVVPVGGLAATINKTTPGTATSPYTAQVTIAPLLARFEVHGKIDIASVTGLENKSKYSKVNVKAIYFNNFKMTRTVNTVGGLTFNDQTSVHDTWYGYYNAGGECQNMFDKIAEGTAGNLTPLANAGQLYGTTPQFIGILAGKAAGYNFFSQSTTESDIEKRREALPHIVVELECWDNEAVSAIVPHKNFITVRTFKDDKDVSINSFDPAYIYRLDLQQLAEWIKGGGEPDPDPEQDAYFINLTLTVTPWTVKNVFPEL